MIVMAFDLSSTQIGVCVAKLNEHDELLKVRTVPIVPKKPTGKDFGFTTQAPKLIAARGKNYPVFLYPNELIVSQHEANRRIRRVKNDKHLGLLKNIGLQLGQLLQSFRPDVVLLEKNKSFNGVLTTKLLAEIAGGIYFYCGATNTELRDYDEATVRAYLRKTVPTFDWANEQGETILHTKWEMFARLKAHYQQHHPHTVPFDHMTMDESDALALFYYWSKTKQGDDSDE